MCRKKVCATRTSVSSTCQGDVVGLHYGLADGDQLYSRGQLGPSQNTLCRHYTTMEDAELAARQAYGVTNPTWLTAYQSNVGNMIQLLRGFGVLVYQSVMTPLTGIGATLDHLPLVSWCKRWGAFH